MPCGAMWALFVFACRGRRPDGPNLGLHKFSYHPQGGTHVSRRTLHHRQGTRALPYKTPCRAGPMCPAANNRCISGNMSLRASDRRHWCGNPYSPARTFCTRKCLRRSTFCQQRQKVPKERHQNLWFWAAGRKEFSARCLSF